MLYINFKKYKRFFAFGCSFTDHIYPTWANIIAKEMPQAKSYNFAKSGSGNPLIAMRIAEANTVMNFCETDLIMVMWTSVTREDRWIKDRWHSYGNVYNNIMYGENYLEKYADPIGYMIRDCALIELTKGYINSLPCDHYMMYSYMPNETESFVKDYKNEVDTYLNKYKNLFSSIKCTLSDFDKNWGSGYTYRTDENILQYDPHPNVLRYYEYLKYIKIPVTELGHNYAIDSYNKLKLCKTRSEIIKTFENEECFETNNRLIIID